jgi:uncharacterized RDD family membrane protein YckC
VDYTQTLAGVADGDAYRLRAEGNAYCSVRRYFAYVIDTLLVGAGIAILMYVAGWLRFSSVYVTNQLGQQEHVPHVAYVGGVEGYLVALAVSLGYFILLEWAAGWTMGKMVLGLRVVTLSGDQISVTQAVIRNLLLLVDGLLGGLVALASMLASDCRQRVGDRVAGTMVVRW